MSSLLKRERERLPADEGPNKKQKVADRSILDYLHDELIRHILVFVPQKRIGKSDSLDLDPFILISFQ